MRNYLYVILVLSVLSICARSEESQTLVKAKIKTVKFDGYNRAEPGFGLIVRDVVVLGILEPQSARDSMLTIYTRQQNRHIWTQKGQLVSFTCLTDQLNEALKHKSTVLFDDAFKNLTVYQ